MDGGNDPGPRSAGVVLRIAGRRALVLADGRFMRVRAVPGWEPGDEVWVSAAVGAWGTTRLRWAVATISTASVVAGGLLASGVASAHVAAVVSIDARPSVQLSVDSAGQVIAAAPMGASAKRVLAQVNVRGLPVGKAIEVLVRRAAADGYLQPNTAQTVLVTVAPSRAPSVPAAVTTGVADGRAGASAFLTQRHVSDPVEVVSAPAAAVPQASRAGLSVGRWAVYQGLTQAGLHPQANDFRKSVAGGMEKAGIPESAVAAVLQAYGGQDPKELRAVVAAAVRGATTAQLVQMMRATAPAMPKGGHANRSAASRNEHAQAGHAPAVRSAAAPTGSAPASSSAAPATSGGVAAPAPSRSARPGGLEAFLRRLQLLWPHKAGKAAGYHHKDGGRASASNAHHARRDAQSKSKRRAAAKAKDAAKASAKAKAKALAKEKEAAKRAAEKAKAAAKRLARQAQQDGAASGASAGASSATSTATQSISVQQRASHQKQRLPLPLDPLWPTFAGPQP